MQTQTITERPARVAGEIARRITTQERRAEKARQRVRELREMAFAEIDRLIAFLDASDSYVMDEREPDDDFEPSLGFLNMFPGRGGASGGFVPDLELDDADDEPSLGAPEYHPAGYIMMGGEANQERWAQGKNDDRERDDADDPKGESVNEDGDGNPDDEPSLGWCENMSQTVPNTSIAGCDLELQDHAISLTRHREATGITVDATYRKFVCGLTDSQREAVRAKMHHDSDVVLR